MSEQHALYRFFDEADQLLYIGITLNPGARWKQHRADKPWWTDVATVTVETHPDRTSVLEAERTAILAEHPLHNVIHNRGSRNNATPATPVLDRLQPVQVGDWVALGMQDGRCPVGGVVATDDTWVAIRLKDFLSGTLTGHVIAERWDNVERVEIAYPELATEPDTMEEFMGAERRMQDEHLGTFQSAWRLVHHGAGRHPLDQAKSDVLREELQEARANR